MKVLILSNNFGGLYSFRREVIEALNNSGYDITICAPNDIYNYYFKEKGNHIQPIIFNRKGTNPLMDMWLIFRFAKIIRKMKPDVVLSYTIKPNLYGGIACQLCDVPQIANVTGLGSAVENNGWLQKLTILLYKIGLRKAHTIFFQNQANMDFCHIHRMIGSQGTLIPGSGVNLTYHSYKEYPAANPLKFIYVGRLMREKGADQYLQAAKQIKMRHPETEFHILGRYEDHYESIVNEMQKKGLIIYHGSQSDVRPYLAECHCTIHPSFYPEGMSNVLLESCATGRPIITTDRPGCGEIVDDGINGFVVKQKDTNDLIEKIEKFINLPYEKKREMGLEARRKVEKEFDRNIVVKAYLACINKIKENLSSDKIDELHNLNTDNSV